MYQFTVSIHCINSLPPAPHPGRACCRVRRRMEARHGQGRAHGVRGHGPGQSALPQGSGNHQARAEGALGGAGRRGKVIEAVGEGTRERLSGVLNAGFLLSVPLVRECVTLALGGSHAFLPLRGCRIWKGSRTSNRGWCSISSGRTSADTTPSPRVERRSSGAQAMLPVRGRAGEVEARRRCGGRPRSCRATSGGRTCPRRR